MQATKIDKLTVKQENAIAALITQPSLDKAAQAAGVSDRSLLRWLKEPAFKTAYRDAQREAFKLAVSMCQKYMPHSVQTLVQVMTDKAAPHSARVSAAGMMMKFGRESIELDDVVERVERLEQAPAPNDARAGGGYAP